MRVQREFVEIDLMDLGSLTAFARGSLRELVNEKVRRERARILESDGPDAEAASGKLPGLLAYKQFVESVNEWPIDTSTLLRFRLYLGLPIGSWLGGALVERLVDVVLDWDQLPGVREPGAADA